MAVFSANSVCLVVAFALLVSFTEGRDHIVGGSADAWKVAASSQSQSDALSKWAHRNRFQIGDSLVFNYDSKKDSVLEVSREAYLSCNTSSPIAVHKESETKVKLDHSGPYYFISGSQPNCEKGQKLIVVVMAARNKVASPAPAPALSPVSESEGPAVAPTSAGFGLGVARVVVGIGALVGFLLV